MTIGVTATGIPFRVRRAVEADRNGLIAMHDRCGSVSRLHRWMGHAEAMPNGYLCDALSGSADHRAMVAELCADQPRLVALGSLVRVTAESYELGVLVEDAFHRVGIGMFLCDRLIAGLPGGCSLIAEAHFENRALLQGLARYGAVQLSHSLGDVTAVVTVTHAPLSRAYASPFRSRRVAAGLPDRDCSPGPAKRP
jgi:hypothetical protein